MPISYPLVMRDYLEPEYRDRIGLVVDSLGDQRARIVNFNPATGKTTLCGCSLNLREWVRWLNLHPDTTLGAMFNRLRLNTWIKALMSVIYGTLNLIFSFG